MRGNIRMETNVAPQYINVNVNVLSVGAGQYLPE